MISLFHKYNITPIFIFDGKPPIEKMDELYKRKEIKIEAEIKFNSLNEDLENITDTEERNKILQKMEKLKKQFVRISEKEINSIKEIITAYGAKYYEANGEADRECALIMSRTNCYACMSDDMDMFVYGCTRVIRYLNLSNESIVIYKMDDILSDLKLSFPLFKQIAILSGTDYNIYDNNNLIETLKWFKEFKKHNNNDDDDHNFYKWLYDNTKYIKDFNSLLKIHEMFNIDNIDFSFNFDNYKVDKNYNINYLRDIMTKYGFLFV